MKSAENQINECKIKLFLFVIDLKYNQLSKAKIITIYCVYHMCKSEIYNKNVTKNGIKELIIYYCKVFTQPYVAFRE